MENTEENCEMIWKIWKKGKLNIEKIGKIWKKIVK
jgi:putative aminopeptidase FrvX